MHRTDKHIIHEHGIRIAAYDYDSGNEKKKQGEQFL